MVVRIIKVVGREANPSLGAWRTFARTHGLRVVDHQVHIEVHWPS